MKNEINEHEVERLYSFKDFIKYKFEIMIFQILTIMLIIGCVYFAISYL